MTQASYLDIPDFRKRVGDDVELMHELFQIYSEEYHVLVENIDRSIRNDDSRGLEEAAHSLKGMSANISAHVVRDIAYELERTGASGDLSKAGELVTELKEGLNKTIELMPETIEKRGIDK
jgi:HPt (histidine-containing phosphotransfer) domain-containing protein